MQLPQGWTGFTAISLCLPYTHPTTYFPFPLKSCGQGLLCDLPLPSLHPPKHLLPVPFEVMWVGICNCKPVNYCMYFSLNTVPPPPPPLPLPACRVTKSSILDMQSKFTSKEAYILFYRRVVMMYISKCMYRKFSDTIAY